MLKRYILILLLIFTFQSCSKDQEIYNPTNKLDPYVLYKDGLEAFERNQFFFAEKKFSEAELNFEIVELSAKSAIMSSFALYGMNFYDQALENLNRYLKTYPSYKNIIYAHYLIAIIYYEQISDEKKDLDPLLKANEKIDFFLKTYPQTDYAVDLRFKKDLIQNQLAPQVLY